MAESGAPAKGRKSQYLSDLKRTSLLQLSLFTLGALGSIMNGVSEIRWMLNMGFGVVWTDNLLLAAIFSLSYLVTKSWAPRASTWFSRTARSMIQWVPISLAGYILCFIL